MKDKCKIAKLKRKHRAADNLVKAVARARVNGVSHIESSPQLVKDMRRLGLCPEDVTEIIIKPSGGNQNESL